MKKPILLFIVLGVVLLSCSCGDKSTQKEQSITVVTSFGAEDGNRSVYEELFKEYQDQYHVTILDNSEISTSEWKTKVLKQFENGEEPDVLFFFSGNLADPIVKNEKVVSVDTIREQYPNYASNINASVLKGMKGMDGGTYTIPVTGYWEGLYINKDLFEEYGIPIPDDWEGFLEAIRKFKENGIVPLAASLSDIPHYLFEYLIYNYTGPTGHLLSVPDDPDNLPESWLEGLRQFQVLYDLGAFPENVNETTNDDVVEMFQDKRAAMLLDGSWTAGNVRDTGNVVVVDFPSMDGRPRKSTDMIAGFSMGFYITRKAWEDPLKREAAVNFVSFMTSNDAIEKFNVGVVTPSISTKKPESAKEPLFQSIVDMNSRSTAYIGAVQDNFKEAAQLKLFESIPGIATGEISPEDALREFIKNNQ